MKTCPECKRVFTEDKSVCPHDGTILVRERKKDPLLNTVVDGKYRILERVGGGGMGSVYRAEHTMMQRIVAVKVLHPRFAEDAEAEQFLMRFQREARTASQINHPNAVTIHDFGIYQDQPYLVMQFVEGQSLRKLLAQKGRLQISTAVSILTQIGAAVQAAHDRGIVHRDLKPDNIMVAERPNGEYSALVLDFGIAKVLRDSGGSDVTKTGRIMGTPQYMAPEQVLGQTIDTRTDIYALGIILYEMLSGDVPFDADSMMPMMMKHVHEPPRVLSEFKPELEIPEEFEAIIMRALAKEPALRQQSARQLLDELAHAEHAAEPHTRDEELGHATIIGAEPELEPISEAEARRSQKLAVSIGVVLVVAVGSFIYDIGNRTDVEPGGSAVPQPTGEQIGGIGIRISRTGEAFRVEEVLPNSPAGQNGVKVGDLIKQIGEIPAAELSLEQAVERFRGNTGTRVLLLLERESADEPLRVSVPRTQIRIPEVDKAKVRADQLWNEGRPEAALELLEGQARSEPESSAAQAYLGVMYQRLGRLSDAIGRYEKAVELDPLNAYAHYNSGHAQFKLGKFAEAERALAQAVALNPTDSDGHRYLAETRAKLGNLEGAVQEFGEAVRLKPGDADLHYQLGLVLAQLGSIPDALGEYELAVKLNPDDSRIRTVLGASYAILSRNDEAQLHLEQALKLNSNNPEAHLHLAGVLAAKEQYEPAIKEYRTALELNPNYVLVHKNLAQLYMQRARFDDAVPELREAIRLSPQEALLHSNLGWSLINLGRFTEAVTALEDAIKLNDRNAVSHYYLGTAYGNLGKFAEARDALIRAVELDPGYAVAHYNLGKAYERLGELDGAKRHFGRAAELAPDAHVPGAAKQPL